MISVQYYFTVPGFTLVPGIGRIFITVNVAEGLQYR